MTSFLLISDIYVGRSVVNYGGLEAGPVYVGERWRARLQRMIPPI